MEPCSKKMIKDYVRVLNSEQKDHLPLVHFEWFESSKWMNKVKSMTYELYEHRFFSWFSYQNKSRFFPASSHFLCVFSRWVFAHRLRKPSWNNHVTFSMFVIRSCLGSMKENCRNKMLLGFSRWEFAANLVVFPPSHTERSVFLVFF